MFARRHGGAWKVAYADFVTAMMALFIVLWMMSATAAVKKSVVGYFKDPRGYTHTLGAGPGHAGEGLVMNQNTLGELQKQLRLALERVPEFQQLRDNIKFSVTGEGLRIDLLENEGQVVGVRAKTPDGELQVLAELVIGADGRQSIVRDKAGLEVQDIGAPMDVLWFRLSRHETDPAQTFGRFIRGRVLVMLNREEYWQC